MKYLSHIWILFLIGCTDTTIDLPPGKTTVVVEGWITDENSQHWVKVSQSTRFRDSKPETVITNATVIIEDNNNQYPLTYNTELGIYQTTAFAGLNGNSYRVIITLQNGSEITSSWESLNSVPPITELQFDTYEDRDPDTGENIIVYYPIVVSQDPLDEQNQYRYKGYRNGIVLNKPEELILLSDEFNNGEILPQHIPEFRLGLSDEITVELHSLSLEAFRFLELLRSQTTSLGSSSGTAPAKLIGNLSYSNRPDDIVIGFFGASSITTSTAIVAE